MAKTKQLKSQEKFKTMIGGQALIEGIMMRGPDKDAVVVRGKEGLTVEVTPRKLPPEHSPLRWPLIRGIYNFFGSNIVGVKALMRSADLSPEEGETEAPSKFDQWLEKKLGNEGFQKALVGFAVVLGLGVALFFPGTISEWWPVNLIWFVLKCLGLMLVSLTLVKSATGRFRIDQAFRFYVTVPTALALCSLILVWVM